MTNIDELAELNYAARDPQFQDEDAVDKELLLNRLQVASDVLEEANDALSAVFEIYESRTLRRVRNLILEARVLLEEEL